LVSAGLKWVVVKTFTFNMAVMVSGQHAKLVLAWLEWVGVKYGSFSMAGMGCGQKRWFQHGWNV
jgi:hypothetical protein